MQWVEIINIRAAATIEPSALERLFRDIRNNVAAIKGKGARVVIYRGGSVDSDWAIHIHRQTDERPAGRTALGIELADTLRPMSLVDHTIWIEVDCRNSLQEGNSPSKGNPTATLNNRIGSIQK